MGDANAYYHLKPIASGEVLDKLWVIRPSPPSKRGLLEKSEYRETRGTNIVQSLIRTYREAVRIGRREQVRAFVSFFAVPYGLIAILAGWRTGKPVHIGFVGSDWYRICQGWYGWLLDKFLQRATLLTVTGPLMREELAARGYDSERISVLPHAIDLGEYHDIRPEERRYDCLFVGALIPRKRVDLILLALAEVKKQFPKVTLCIVGDGPLRGRLESQVQELGLSSNVTFMGYQDNPSRCFEDARIAVIASDMEGLPFALVEAMAAGTIPICTSVGTIADFVEHGETALTFPAGNAAKMAEAISWLLGNPNAYQHIRQNVIAKRSELGFDDAIDFWMRWLATLGRRRRATADHCPEN